MRKPPKLCKDRNYAVVKLPDSKLHRRRNFYCGDWGTPEAKKKYKSIIAEWEAAGRRWPLPEIVGGITVAELIQRYWRWAQTEYSRGECGCIKSAWTVLEEHYGSVLATDFGPVKLAKLRDAMIGKKWGRLYINKSIGRVCAMFRWGAANELLPVAVYQALKTLPGLKAGRTKAKEGNKVKAVSQEHIEAIEPFVSRSVWNLIQVQRLTGARPGEILRLRPADIDRSGKVWHTKLTEHKTAYRGKRRVIYFGPKAQAVLKPLLQIEHDKCIFRPSGLKCNKHVGEHYTKDSYRVAIQRACVAAGIPKWHPHQLRHAAATEIEKRYGTVAAQVFLGHSSAGITEAVYVHRDKSVSEKVARGIG